MDIYSDELTKKEKQIYKAIIFQGCDYKELAEKFNLKRTTIATHLDSICQKKQIYGLNRLHSLSAQFWGEIMEKWNCDKCKFKKDGACSCLKSYFYGDAVNDGMLCPKFKIKEKEEQQ